MKSDFLRAVSETLFGVRGRHVVSVSAMIRIEFNGVGSPSEIRNFQEGLAAPSANGIIDGS
jgi:hypothetical protein